MYPAIRSYRARVRWLLSHQHRPDVKELLRVDRHKKYRETKSETSWQYKMWDITGKDKNAGEVPFPLSCQVNQQSSGHSWGRLGLCTRLCETVAQCLSALQIPCWQTTAAAGKHNTQCKCSRCSKRLAKFQVNVLYLSFTCLTAVEVTQMVDLQVQRGNFQILYKKLKGQMRQKKERNIKLSDMAQKKKKT